MAGNEAKIAEIAQESINCIESVAETAKNSQRNYRGRKSSSLVQNNTFNRPEGDSELGKIHAIVAKENFKLMQEPVIARVQYRDEDDQENTIFICRCAAPSNSGFTIASYRSALGRLASLEAGEEDEFFIGNRNQYLSVENSAKLYPRRSAENWDSLDTEIDIEDYGKRTIPSLRDWLESHTAKDRDDLKSAWDDDVETESEGGIRRRILTQIALRDQPILDKYQDEIFRMPINSMCFLSGPPGTGKTTTLIRRLGQKTDMMTLLDSMEEYKLVRQVAEETETPHEHNWIMFSPTELLKQYVKEAFNREGIAASDHNIQTWKDYRRKLARDMLDLLRTGSNTRGFVEREDESHLEVGEIDDMAWHDDFREYLETSVANELKTDAESLAKSELANLKSLGKRLLKLFRKRHQNFYADAILGVANLMPDIRDAIAMRSDAIERILARARNNLINVDPGFPDKLCEEISRQLESGVRDLEDDDELEASLEDEDEAIQELKVGRPVGRRQALKRLEAALKTFARARLGRRSISEKSQSGRLLAWLEPERLPSDEDISDMGKLLAEQALLRKLTRLERMFLRSIPAKYRRYRIEKAKESLWYRAVPSNRFDIHWRELDIVILATLQVANQLLQNYRGRTGVELPEDDFLLPVGNLLRAQVLVDEATDFSGVQLACMYELAHPAIRSFFLCGDLNQRLTLWGIKSNLEVERIAPKIQHQTT